MRLISTRIIFSRLFLLFLVFSIFLLATSTVASAEQLDFNLLAGKGVPAQTINRLVGPQDIAATIAAYLEIKPPSGSVGIPLVEVLNEKPVKK